MNEEAKISETEAPMLSPPPELTERLPNGVRLPMFPLKVAIPPVPPVSVKDCPAELDPSIVEEVPEKVIFAPAAAPVLVPICELPDKRVLPVSVTAPAAVEIAGFALRAIPNEPVPEPAVPVSARAPVPPRLVISPPTLMPWLADPEPPVPVRLKAVAEEVPRAWTAVIEMPWELALAP